MLPLPLFEVFISIDGRLCSLPLFVRVGVGYCLSPTIVLHFRLYLFVLVAFFTANWLSPAVPKGKSRKERVGVSVTIVPYTTLFGVGQTSQEIWCGTCVCNITIHYKQKECLCVNGAGGGRSFWLIAPQFSSNNCRVPKTPWRENRWK